MKTALITGATEGIGLEFARLLARKGVNLILVARNEARLQAVAEELTALKVEVKTYAKDLSRIENAVEVYEDIKARGVIVDYVINNAGFGLHGNFTDIPWDQELNMLNLNMVAVAYFTKVFTRDMVQYGYGRILNLGSTGAYQPGPYMAAYCATKAFVLSLSEAVAYELQGTNVTVSTLCPGVTDSQFHKRAHTENTGMSRRLSHATPTEVAAYGYKLMMSGKPSGIYGFTNRIMIFLNRLTPRRVVTSISAKVLKGRS